MIVFLTNIPTPYRTAFFNEASDIARAAGLDISVLYCARTEAHRSWPFEPDRMRHRFEILSGRALRAGRITFHFNPQIRAKLRALAPRLIICAGSWNTPTVIQAVMGGLTRPAPILFWSEGHDDAMRYGSGPVAWLRSAVLRRFDGFVTPNSRSAAWVAAIAGGQRPNLRLPNLIEEERFRIPMDCRQTQRHRARAALGIARDTRLILQVGQLIPRKGVLELADAFLRSDDRKGAHLAFVGSGDLAPELAARAADADGAIRLFGEASVDQVCQYLAAADVFALNTFIDPNPLSPIEAAFAGLPLILSARAGNIDEVIVDGITGQRINDPTAPDAALHWALTATGEDLHNAGAAGQEHVTRNFSRQAAVARFIEDAKAMIAANA